MIIISFRFHQEYRWNEDGWYDKPNVFWGRVRLQNLPGISWSLISSETKLILQVSATAISIQQAKHAVHCNCSYYFTKLIAHYFLIKTHTIHQIQLSTSTLVLCHCPQFISKTRDKRILIEKDKSLKFLRYWSIIRMKFQQKSYFRKYLWKFCI